MTRKKKFDWPTERRKFLDSNPELKKMDEDLTNLEQSLFRDDLERTRHWIEQRHLQTTKHFKVSIKLGLFKKITIGLFRTQADAEEWVQKSFANEIAKDGSYFPKLQYRIQESLP
jgi:hypothetical protein